MAKKKAKKEPYLIVLSRLSIRIKILLASLLIISDIIWWSIIPKGSKGNNSCPLNQSSLNSFILVTGILTAVIAGNLVSYFIRQNSKSKNVDNAVTIGVLFTTLGVGLVCFLIWFIAGFGCYFTF